MTWIMVDVEADGPCPGLFSMIEVGAVVVERGTPRTFYGSLRPLENAGWDTGALNAIGSTREATLSYEMPQATMDRFRVWVQALERPMFVSDNNGFDWQFVNWYFHRFCGGNPFGFSSTNLGSLYKGMVKNMTKNFKHLRKTKHTHNPVDDCMGNVEAMLSMVDRGLHIPGVQPY